MPTPRLPADPNPDREPEPAVDVFPVVGVGASAGGLEAFCRLLRSLPARPGLTLLLVQHLDPGRGSRLSEILTRETTLPVREATDGTRLEVDRVYVIPPDTRMGVEGGVIRLERRGERSAQHMPVDHLFRSLAAEFGPRAVAVVLSGGGTDGTLGMADIREAGGMTFAQDAASAGQAGMPASAADAGHADVVLPPQGIAAALVRLAGNPHLYRPAAESAEAPADGEPLTPLFSLLRSRTGVDFTHYKQNTIRRRVERRLAIREFAGVAELVQAVRDDPAELSAVYRDLLIGVTRFFRDPEIFERLQQVAVPALLADRAADATLRVWVPGCSTGEEAYSVAIVILEALGDAAADTAIKILATDASEDALARARTGTYPENIAADVSPERLRRFFRKADGGYRVAPAVRDLCVFARHDLTADPPFARMDLVSCRNVLIYFDAALQRRVIPLFHYALRPGGFLLLGPSETLGQSADLFVPADRDGRLYTRSLGPGRGVTALAGLLPSWGRLIGAPPTGPVSDTVSLPDIQREADRVLARYAPAGVLIDDQMTILQFRGDTDPYLRHPHGAASLDLLPMAREGLLAELRDGVAAARSANAAVRRRGVLVGEGEAVRSVDLRIVPLVAHNSELRCFLVLFEEEGSERPSAAAPPAMLVPTNVTEAVATERVQQLGRELEANREYQQAIVEDYEAANEELKSANEEILASNEEIQSTNEELQTAKEEMQSANEELETVNEELEHRNRELGRANDDLRSLLVGVNVPVVVVGRDLRIRRLTAQAERVFGLLPSDVGRPLRDIRPELDVPDLGGTIARVIESLEAAAFEARDRTGRWFSVRVRPYETDDYRIDGAVVTAIDVDALKRTEEDLRASRDFVTTILDTVGESLLVLDADLRICTVNRSFQRTFGVPAGDATGRRLFDLGAGEWDSPVLRDLLARARASDGPTELTELDLIFPQTGRRTLRVSLRPVAQQGSQGPLVLLAIDDVTEERRAETVRRELEMKMFQAQKLESLGVMAGGVAHDLNNLLTPVLGYAELARAAVPQESPAVRMLDEATRATRMAADLVQQILAYSGKSRRDVRTADVSAMVRGIDGLLERVTATHGAELRYDLAPTPLPVAGDAAQLSQVVMNLVTNAAEATDGAGHVIVRTESVRADRAALASPYLVGDDLSEGPYAVLEVSDDGRGMTAETLARLFDPFYTTKFTGRGLGLAAVLGIVRGHGGTIQVQSELGRGSSVRVLLPLAAAAPVPAISGRDVAVEGWRGSGTVMVVDDDEAVRGLVCLLLRQAGFAVLEARDGQEAVDLFRAHGHQIRSVLLDLTMPRMGGLEAAAALRALRPDVRILVMSGCTDAEETGRLGDQSIEGFIRKPLAAGSLIAALRTVLGP